MLLLRHASAGERLTSPGVDRFRRLDEAGRAAARGLVAALADLELTRIVSSSFPRCVESVIPLAESRHLVVESRWELEPGARPDDLRLLLDDLPETALACTHREVFETLLGADVTCEKGGTWLLARSEGAWVPDLYLPPPAIPSSDAAAAAGSRSY